MNLRTVYILFGALVVVLAVFGVLQLMKVKKDGGEDWVLPGLHEKKAEVKASEIDAVEMERYVPGSDRKEIVIFTRGSDGWRMQKPHDLRVQTFLVDGLVDQLLRARREKSENMAGMDELGLNLPAVEVTIRKGEKAWSLKVSKPPIKGSGGVVYALNPANPKEPMAVKYNDLDNLFKPVNEFRSRELLAASAFTTTSVLLKDAKTEVLLEKSPDGQWSFKKPPYGPADLDGDTTPPPPFGAPPPPPKAPGGVRGLLDAVTGLRVETDADFVADGASDADLASKYGLTSDKPEKLKVEIKATRVAVEGEKQATSETLLVGKKVENERKDDKTEYYYARIDGERSVAKVPGAKLELMLKVLADPQALRDKSLLQADASRKDRIDAVNVTNSGGSFRLRKGDGLGDWKLYRGEGASQATDSFAVRDLLDALTARGLVKTFLDKDDGLEFDKPSATLAFWFEGVSKPEKKDPENKDPDKPEEPKDDGKEPKLKSDKPTVTLTFGKRDRDKGLVYVRREAGDDKTIVTVSDSLVDKVTAGPLAYLDRKLPGFTTDAFDVARDVTKLTLVRGGQTWELAKEKENDKPVWKVVQPKESAGRTANELTVTAVLRDLSLLRPIRLVAEKATEAELDQHFGLKTPSSQATVTVTKDGKAEDFVYQFGKESEDKQGVYAKQGQRDLIFLASKNAAKGLQRDIRDVTIFRSEPGKVKAVKLSGWKKTSGVVDTLELERKGEKQWEVKAPAGFPIDNDVVELFVQGLTGLRAERFVTPKPGVKTDLDVNDGALQIELTVEGEAKPIVLTIGAEDPDAKTSLFAKSSTHEGDVFHLPRLVYEKARDGRPYFAKK